MRLLDFIRKLAGEESVRVSGNGGGRRSAAQRQALLDSPADPPAAGEATASSERPAEPRKPQADPFETRTSEYDPADEAGLMLFPDVWLPPRRR